MNNFGSYRLMVKLIGWTFLFTLSSIVYANTTVHYYTWRAAEADLFKAISNQGLIPGVSIKTHLIYEPNKSTYEAHVMLEMYNNNVDLFEWPPGAKKLKPLVDEGLIAPFDGDLSTINKSALVAGLGADGQYYGVPFAFQMESLLTNMKLLRKYGVTSPPQDIQELESVFDKIKNEGLTPIQINGTVNWYLAQVVAEVLISGLVSEEFSLGLEEGRYCFNSNEYQIVFDTLQRWKSNGYFNSNLNTEDYGGMNNAVALGNAAMSLNGGWMTGPNSVYRKADPDFEFGFWPVPGKTGKVYVFGDGTYQVNNKSPRLEAAKKVLKFTTTKKFAEMFAQYVRELPVYQDTINIDDPVLSEMIALVNKKAYSVSLFSAYSLNKGDPSYNDLVIESVRNLFDGEMTPLEAAEHIQKGLNSWNYIGTKNCST